MLPTTSSLAPGFTVPIPTFPFIIAPFVGAVFDGYPTDTAPDILSLEAGVLVPIPIFPLVSIRIFSTLFVRNERAKLSVVPTKLLFGSVPELPTIAHGMTAAPVGVCQLASHTASDMSILPAHGDPPVILTCPATSSRVPGLAVPIPTFPEVSITILDVFPPESKL